MVLPSNGILSGHRSHKCKTELFALFGGTLCIVKDAGQAGHGKKEYLSVVWQLFWVFLRTLSFHSLSQIQLLDGLLGPRASISRSFFLLIRKNVVKSHLGQISLLLEEEC